MIDRTFINNDYVMGVRHRLRDAHRYNDNVCVCV